MKLLLRGEGLEPDVSVRLNKRMARSTNSIVYLAERDNNGELVQCIVKELLPKQLLTQNKIKRTVSGIVKTRVTQENSEWYSSIDRFCLAAKRQILHCKQHPYSASTVELLGLYQCRGTYYTVAKRYEGSSWDKLNDLSLYEILKRGKELTLAVNEWHNDGYLLIDIKDSNVLITFRDMNSSTEKVLLCDFDAVVPEKEAFNNRLRYSSETAAPELIHGYLNDVCKVTDVYAIAATIYKRITGNVYRNSKNPRYCFKHILPSYEMKKELAFFFSRALNDNTKHRISNCCELYEELIVLEKRLFGL